LSHHYILTISIVKIKKRDSESPREKLKTNRIAIDKTIIGQDFLIKTFYDSLINILCSERVGRRAFQNEKEASYSLPFSGVCKSFANNRSLFNVPTERRQFFK